VQHNQNEKYPIRLVFDHLSSVGLIDKEGAVNVERLVSLSFLQLVELGVFIAKPAELDLIAADSPLRELFTAMLLSRDLLSYKGELTKRAGELFVAVSGR
jgi:hypothetical protein